MYWNREQPFVWVTGSRRFPPKWISKPTTGVEHWVLHRRKVRNTVVTEVGGAVIGLWSRYLNPEISAVLFFIDIDNKTMISEAAVELYTFLTCASLGVCS